MGRKLLGVPVVVGWYPLFGKTSKGPPSDPFADSLDKMSEGVRGKDGERRPPTGRVFPCSTID